MVEPPSPYPARALSFSPWQGFFNGKIYGKICASVCNCALIRRIKNRIKPWIATVRYDIPSLLSAVEHFSEVTYLRAFLSITKSEW